ncbi:MAG: peptide chain release factor N(5)-glutamine methyltransferase [Calditrichaeota bacterium]|nr:peptide chain release factor N(5)-glutamine methyltransferase [Calditrichota bacterium]
MTIAAALADGSERLTRADFVLRPLRHAEILLETALGVNRAGLYLRAREDLPAEAAHRYESMLIRRLAGEPLQYITGIAPFYGLDLEVGPGVFIPRFDSEALIARFESLVKKRNQVAAPMRILDLCCGSGALGLASATVAARARVVLSDLHPVPLEYASRNAARLLMTARVDIVPWDALIEPPGEWVGAFDYILANPPYISLSGMESLHSDVRDGEPREALTDGGSGLTFYRRWAVTIPRMMAPGGVALIEVGDEAPNEVLSILLSGGRQVSLFSDLSGLPRGVEWFC